MADDKQPDLVEQLASKEVSKIDAPYRAAGISDVAVGGGVLIQTLPQMIEGAKLMAKADICLPVHARERPEICFAIMMRTENWKLRDPFFVAEHSYVVKQRRKLDNGQWGDVETLAFDAAIFQAVLLGSGAIIGRPQYTYKGEGAERTCTVSVMDAQSRTWEEITTPPMKVVHPGHVTKDGQQYVKGSPMWDKNPDQQIAYWGLRNLVRLKYQDVLGGFYDRYEREEYADLGLEDVPEASPSLMDRLPGRVGGDGFAPDHAQTEAEEATALSKAERIKQARIEGLKKARAAKAAGKGKKAPARAAAGGRGARSRGEGVAQTPPQPEPAQARPGEPPRTRAEYVEYARREFKTQANVLGWFYGDDQSALRKVCGIDNQTFTMLQTVMRETMR